MDSLVVTQTLKPVLLKPMTNEQTYLSDQDVLNGAPDAPLNPGGPAPNDGRIAPLDGSRTALTASGHSPQSPANMQEALLRRELGPNNERLEELRPDLVNSLRELEVQYRQEGIVARRHEIRRIRQARLFWQGLQYAWWNPQDMTWHLPYESKIYDDSAMAEMPRYQFVTNIYQAFGLSFVSVLSQDVPATRFYPQSAQSIADVTTARAASRVSSLIEQNNRVQHLLTGVAFYLWTDGKIGGYVRYVADAQRFGSHDEPVIEEHYVPLGEDTYVCPECGQEQTIGPEPAGTRQAAGDAEQESPAGLSGNAGIPTPHFTGGDLEDASRGTTRSEGPGTPISRLAAAKRHSGEWRSRATAIRRQGIRHQCFLRSSAGIVERRSGPNISSLPNAWPFR
jgi:hypothetical protein